MDKQRQIAQPLYQNQHIRALEQAAIAQLSLDESELMARAGAAAFALMSEVWPLTRYVGVMCGAGNNAGDGYVLARLVQQAGMHVTVFYLADPQQLRGAALTAMQACQQAGVALLPFSLTAAQQFCQSATAANETSVNASVVWVDALLGTGLSRDVSGEWQQAIDWMNQQADPILALDVPSGLNSDNGQVHGIAVQADLTCTFIGDKRGLHTGEGPHYCGAIVVEDLQLPATLLQQVNATCELLDIAQLAATHLPLRMRTAHKGRFGHVLVVGGNYGMAGAVRLAGEAALRVGAGLVSIATRPEHINGIMAQRPELMCHGIANVQALEPLLARATVLVVGPGLGQDDWAQQLWRHLSSQAQPKVVDADALNLLAGVSQQRRDWVLTPHPGEASRLLGGDSAAIQQDRFQAITEIQQRYGGVVVLKGAGSLIKGAEPWTGICGYGNPGMASGGMGDVLSGVIAGLLAQGLSLSAAAALGVCLHAKAADNAALGGERGLLASDVIAELRALVNMSE